MDTQRQKDKGKKSENPGRRGSQKGRFRRHAMGTRQSGEEEVLREGGPFSRARMSHACARVRV